MSLFRTAVRDPSEVFTSTLWHPITGAVMEFLAASPLFLITDVHFVGRLELCTTQLAGCPLCELMPPRRIGMLFSGTQRSLGMLQIGDATIAQITEQMSADSIRHPAGLRFQFLRKTDKRPLMAKIVGRVDLTAGQTVTVERAYQAALRLFSLPCGTAQMSFAELEAHAEPFLVNRLLRVAATIKAGRQIHT